MNHHWTGLKPKPDKYFGFVYRITENKTGRFYIGKRQYWVTNGRVKKTTLRPDKSPTIWNPSHWKESKWQFYRSSSRELANLIEQKPKKSYTFEIIGQYTCKADLVYAECKAQMDYDCMTVRDTKGDRLSYNRQIAAVRFVPPWLEHEEKR